MGRVYQSSTSEFIKMEGFQECVEEYKKSSTLGLDLNTFTAEIYPQLEKAGVLKAAVAVDEDKVVGFVTVVSYQYDHAGQRVAAVESIFVAEAYRKKGYGVKLLNQAKELAKSLGAVGLFIGAGIGTQFEKVCQKKYRAVNTVFWEKLTDD